jgi:hypothetical protein
MNGEARPLADEHCETTESVRNFLQCLAGDRAREAQIELKPLRGGLEAMQVTLVTARYRDAAGRL